MTSTEPCVSSFDSILFALNAKSGNAAYDLQTGATDDRSAIWRGQKVQNITARGGKVVLDTGLNAGAAPPPPPPPAPQGTTRCRPSSPRGPLRLAGVQVVGVDGQGLPWLRYAGQGEVGVLPPLR